jgi:hypothetical protein
LNGAGPEILGINSRFAQVVDKKSTNQFLDSKIRLYFIHEARFEDLDQYSAPNVISSIVF